VGLAARISSSALFRRRGTPRVAVLAAIVLGTTAIVVPAMAATPAGGTISDASPTATWTAGPFAVPNVTGTVGTPTCGTATPCDDYKLTVDVPAGYDTDHSVRVEVSWPQTAADFDVYVLDSAGNSVSSAASSSDPETLLLPAVAASYTVRVVPFAPLGQSITGAAKVVTNPAQPGPSTAPAPGFRTYTPPETFTNAHSAGEPSIGDNWKTGAAMYQSYTSTFKATFDSAGTATWTDVSANVGNGCPQGSLTSLDPILYTDHSTGRTFESQLAGKTALTCYTDDDGQTWNPTSGSGINSGVDHQTLGGGAFHDGALGGVTSDRAVYYCSQDIADASCAVSRDGGTTYGPAVPMYSLLDCGGLHGHAKVAPDGTVYVPNKGCGGNQGVAVSTDNGLSWTLHKVPTSTPGDSDPSVGIGSDGTVYFGYQNSDGTAHVAVSHDQGKTWVDDQNVGAQLGIKNIVFPATVAGDGDRAAFAFLGTTTGGDYQDAANFQGVWHPYVATTYDGGLSWITTDAASGDPVQKGSICTAGTTCGNDRNLLDFIDATIDQQGRVLVAYADGCTGACATGGAQNFDALATIARQSSGNTLFGAYDAVVSGKHVAKKKK
jgi:hypothetical protein